MERCSPGDGFGVTEGYQQLQRIECTTQGYQISCPLFQREESLKWWCPDLAVHTDSWVPFPQIVIQLI